MRIFSKVFKYIAVFTGVMALGEPIKASGIWGNFLFAGLTVAFALLSWRLGEESKRTVNR